MILGVSEADLNLQEAYKNGCNKEMEGFIKMILK